MKVKDKIVLFISLSSLIGYVFFMFNKNIFNATQLLMLSIFTLLPMIIEKIIKYTISDIMHYIYLVFLLLHFILGEVCMFYINVKLFDTFLHYCSAIVICLLGYGIINSFIKENYYYFKVIFSIMFSVCLEYIWELLEYSIDEIFLTNMQRYIKNNATLIGHNALNDTMKDMYIAIMGCVSFLLLVNIKKIKNIKLINKI